MAMGPIVHIGFHKTATSWFQLHVYPRVRGHRVVDRPLVRRALLGGDAFNFHADAARAALGVGAGEGVILCEEDLSGVLHNGVVSGYVAKEVAARVRAALPDARVVIFVREQGSAALSWYLQYLREGGTASLRRYLFPELYRHLGHDRPFKVPRFCWSQLDYAGLVRRYDDLFGRDRVVVLPFELLRRDRAALLARLGAALGVELPDPGPARANEAYRRGLLPLVRTANLFTRRSVVDKAALLHLPYWYTVRKALFERLNRLAPLGPPPRPHTALDVPTRAWIAQRFWRCNRYLAERTGVDLAELGYATAEPDRPAPAPARSPALAWFKN